MQLGDTHSIVSLVEEFENCISEREQEIERLQVQHNIPSGWLEEKLDTKTHNSKTDAAKEAYLDILRYKVDIQEYLDKLGISREKLNAITMQISRGEVNVQDVKMEIVEANLSLVVGFAKQHRNEVSDAEFLEIIQEGNIGLMKAVDNYEYQSGYQFKTYATWWIRQHISRAIADQKSIRKT